MLNIPHREKFSHLFLTVLSEATMKTVFLKVTGVSPAELSELHRILGDDLTIKSETTIGSSSGPGRERVGSEKLVQMKSCKLQGSKGTYTVGLELRAEIEGTTYMPSNPDTKPCCLYLGQDVLNGLWNALHIFPPTETIEKK